MIDLVPKEVCGRWLASRILMTALQTLALLIGGIDYSNDDESEMQLFNLKLQN